MEWTLPWDIVGRIAVAALLGAVIGLERELDDHPAGLRTLMTVAIGAAVFGAVSTVGFNEFEAVRASTNVQIDVTRVASQVVVGIGFLGAGLIFRRGETVMNLTTAASLWATAAVGLAAGVGNVGMAVTATVVIGVSLYVLPLPERSLVRRFGRSRRLVTMAPRPTSSIDELRAYLDARNDVRVDLWRVDKRAGNSVVRCHLIGKAGTDLDVLLADLAQSDLVEDLHTE